jgi:excinuclease ABC subunit C
VLTARKRDLGDAKIYFGPFPSAGKVRETLKILRKVFPYSTCKPNSGRACLDYHLGLCPGVCLGIVSEKNYKKNIRAITLFLKGDKSKLIKDLEKEVAQQSRKLNFEEAAISQRRLEALSYITRPTRLAEEYFEEDLAALRAKELSDLVVILGLGKKPNRIECYDVSDIGGKEAVGSMVVFSAGEADRAEYRRFKIKKVASANDTAMMAEIIDRRLNHEWKLPDLIIVDGGKGQLNAALDVLAQRNLNIPTAALAKRLEEIYLPNRKEPLELPRQSDALKLVQRIRDEAHRFAIAYHRKLRKKAAFD